MRGSMPIYKLTIPYWVMAPGLGYDCRYDRMGLHVSGEKRGRYQRD